MKIGFRKKFVGVRSLRKPMSALSFTAGGLPLFVIWTGQPAQAKSVPRSPMFHTAAE